VYQQKKAALTTHQEVAVTGFSAHSCTVEQQIQPSRKSLDEQLTKLAKAVPAKQQ